jgi:hypothetical protein
MKNAINTIMIVIGMLILGAIRVDIYVAHGFPNAILTIILARIIDSYESLQAFLVTIWTLSYYYAIVFLLLAWRLPRFRALFGYLAIISASASACYMLWLASGSGYSNEETYIGSAVSLVVLIPNLLYMTIKRANKALQAIGDKSPQPER